MLEYLATHPKKEIKGPCYPRIIDYLPPLYLN